MSMSRLACSSGNPPRTIVLSSMVCGGAARISFKESVSNSTISARPAGDPETLMITVNFCELLSKNCP